VHPVVGEYISSCPMSLKCLECPVSKLINSDACHVPRHLAHCCRIPAWTTLRSPPASARATGRYSGIS
jgi:hypothetical protein